MANPSPLEGLAPNLWIATRALPILVGDIGTRMTVIRLADGSLFLHSPVTLDAATRAALDSLGPVRHVIAPSKAHSLFAAGYKPAYPDARLYGAPGLAERKPALGIDAVLGDESPPAWRDEIEQHVFRGAAVLNEVVFFHRATRTLLLTDLAFNVPHGRTAGARVFHWLVGTEGRFGPHRLVRLGIRDHAAARRSLERILAWDFDRVVVTHGDVLESGGKARLREAFAFLGGAG